MDHQTPVTAFIQRWRGVTASELSTSQSFVIQLCELLGVEAPHPEPAHDERFVPARGRQTSLLAEVRRKSLRARP